LDLIMLMDFGIEYAEGVERCANNAALYEKLLKRYADEEQRTAELQYAMQNKDYDTLFSIVHEIKGVAGNLGIVPLYDAASDVVLMLRGKKYDCLEDAVNELTAVNEAAVSCIHAALR